MDSSQNLKRHLKINYTYLYMYVLLTFTPLLITVVWHDGNLHNEVCPKTTM